MDTPVEMPGACAISPPHGLDSFNGLRRTERGAFGTHGTCAIDDARFPKHAPRAHVSNCPSQKRRVGPSQHFARRVERGGAAVHDQGSRRDVPHTRRIWRVSTLPETRIDRVRIPRTRLPALSTRTRLTVSQLSVFFPLHVHIRCNCLTLPLSVTDLSLYPELQNSSSSCFPS